MSARTELLDFLRDEVNRPLSREKLYQQLDIKADQRKMLDNLLDDLVKTGFVFKNSVDQYGVPEKFNLIGGRIDKTPSGNGFLIPDDPEKEDIFISSGKMNGAMHNDKVFIRLLPHSRGKSAEGEVAEIVERANKQVVGNLEKKKNYGFVVPDNQRICNDVFIPPEHMQGAKDGQKVVVEIINWPESNRNSEGKIVEILGFKGDPGVDIEAIIRQLDLPGEFPADVKKVLNNIPDEVKASEHTDRRDLRDLKMVTIDGADAKDLDDAVSIEKLADDKYRLGVHIADVTHYVKEDSPLDQEAFERGTSIYLVDRVIPMLPRKLSNGICSLNPQVNRLALTAMIDYKLTGKDGAKVDGYEIFPSLIRTNYRLTYDEVREILDKDNQAVKDEFSDFVDELELMNELRRRLRKQRFNSGSIDFDFPEVKVELDSKGKPIHLRKRIHGISEQLIEEFMIAANNVVAADMFWREEPFVYRVHDQPDPDRLQQFNEFIHNFGYHVKGDIKDIHPRALQEVLAKVAGTAEERIIDTVLLRSMKKAVYATKNIGHFGLAIEHYTHFTSPIRRYPDLIVHRLLKEIQEKGSFSKKRTEELERKLPIIADQSSLQERRAMEAERDSVKLKKIEYMVDQVGEEFSGIISGITGFGFFVELDNTVEGLVHVKNMDDDYYHYDESVQAMIGERTKNMYRLGDEVRIKVSRVSLEDRELDFQIIED